MKRKLLIIAGILSISGLAITLFSAVVFGPDKLKIYEESAFEKKVYVNKIDDINKINLTTVNHKIEVVESKDEQINLTYYENDKHYYEIKNENGTISIRARYKFNFFQDIAFMFRGFTTEKITITLEIPKAYNNDLSLETVNESIEIAEGFSFNNLKVKAVNSGLTVNNTKANDFNISTVNGTINLGDLAGSKIKSKTVNGSVLFANLAFNNYDLSTVNGKIKGSVIGVSETFNISVSKVNGDKNIANQKVPDSNKSLDLSTVNGDILINFINN